MSIYGWQASDTLGLAWIFVALGSVSCERQSGLYTNSLLLLISTISPFSLQFLTLRIILTSRTRLIYHSYNLLPAIPIIVKQQIFPVHQSNPLT